MLKKAYKAILGLWQKLLSLLKCIMSIFSRRGCGVSISENGEEPAPFVPTPSAPSPSPPPSVPAVKVGVYYFPGWSTPGGGVFPSDPWSVIPQEKLPLIGAYDETDQAICDYQLSQMVAHGIDFVMIDWYWDYTNDQPYLDHWINNYLASTVPNKPKFALLFAFANFCDTPEKWQFTYNYWITNYFGNSNYYKVDGKPLVIFFDSNGFYQNLGGGSDSAISTYLTNARTAENVAHGTGGIYFVGDTYFSVEEVGAGPGSKTAQGYDALSVYNMISGFEWSFFKAIYLWWYGKALESSLPLFAPISTGWDDRPWGSTQGGLRANPTLEQFTDHLLDAKTVALNNPVKVKGVIVEAWNEYGEGNVIEPSGLNGGLGRLEAIRSVFKGY